MLDGSQHFAVPEYLVEGDIPLKSEGKKSWICLGYLGPLNTKAKAEAKVISNFDVNHFLFDIFHFFFHFRSV